VRVVAVVGDLIALSRIDAAARHAGASLTRVDGPDQIPPPAGVDLLLVNWDERKVGWGEAIAAWTRSAGAGRQPAIVLFGPHVDVAAHAEARRHGIGPVWGRGKLVAMLPRLLGSPDGRAAARSRGRA
jgi:hypothetical protein